MSIFIDPMVALAIAFYVGGGLVAKAYTKEKAFRVTPLAGWDATDELMSWLVAIGWPLLVWPVVLWHYGEIERVA